jgi:thioredoxin reductase (NADPH)
MAIIGCGPAGLSAAINGRARGKEVKVFGVKLCSPALHKAHRIDNYLGFPEIRGDDLRKLFLDHARSMGVVPDTESVTAVYPMGDYFELQLRRENLQARTLIITTGVSVARPIPGEEEFIGRGVSYCATCDGNFYKGKKVAVIADSPEGEEEVNFLAELAAAIWYIPLYQGEYNLRGNVEVLEDRPVEVVGGQRLEKLVLKSGRELSVDGCFFHKEQLPAARIVPGLELEKNHIKVNRDMSTNIPGLFAAGDVTGRPYQLAKAVGEGQIAALSAAKYLDSLA